MSKVIDEQETQQLKYIQQFGGKMMNTPPQFSKKEKPYSIQDDVFSIGCLLVEVFLQRPLIYTEWDNLKTKSLVEIIPELSICDNTDNSKFVHEILTNMVNPDKALRLELITLLQKIQEFKVNEDSLKSLKIKLKLKQELKRISFNGKNNITNQVDLSNYQEVELDYYNCFEKIFLKQVFGVQNVIKAINIVSQQDQIVSLILNLSSNKIGPEGAIGIGAGLQKLQNLTNLSLNTSYNLIGSQGAKDIAAGLQYLQNLTDLSLNMCTNQIGLDGAKCIIASLQKLQKVNNLSLNISSNQIGPKGAKSISADLGKLHNLTNLSLNISWNKVGPEGAKLIGASFERLQNLTNLSLDINFFNRICVHKADLGMSKAIDKPETQQLKSTQSLDGNTKFMSPEVFKGEKPYSIKADIFSIGQLLVEVFLQRPLTPTEWLNLKTKSLFECIPELSIHDNTNNSKFVYEILANMVNPDKAQRLEPVTLLQKLNEIQKQNINEDSLKSLKLKQKLKQELKRISFSSENNITNQVDLSSYQVVELNYDECFKKILFYQVFGISDVVKAIKIISQQDQIITLILDLNKGISDKYCTILNNIALPIFKIF
ncbi:hypothetical protein ABPG74_019880 [Tetrahymena malaccensis]